MNRRIIASFAVAVGSFQVAELPVAPTKEVANRCQTYSYLAYPYKRPGSVKGSGEREAYRRDCIIRNGDVPKPEPAPKAP